MATTDLNSLIIGSGKPVILLHGWKQSGDNMYPLAELFFDEVQSHLIDLPGFGSSPAPDEVWGSPEYARRILRYMDEQGIERADFIGHSFGGKIAICIGANNPERVGRLVLIGSAGLQRKLTFRQVLRRRMIRRVGTSTKSLDRLFGSRLYERFFIPRFGSRDYLNAGPLRPILVKGVNEDLSPLLPRIAAPSLLLWGKEDQETPVEMGERMATLIPGSRLIVLPHKGHTCFEDIGSHLCARYIRDFLGLRTTEHV